MVFRFSLDTVQLAQRGQLGAALLNIGLNVGLCLATTAAGWWLGQQ